MMKPSDYAMYAAARLYDMQRESNVSMRHLDFIADLDDDELEDRANDVICTIARFIDETRA